MAYIKPWILQNKHYIMSYDKYIMYLLVLTPVLMITTAFAMSMAGAMIDNHVQKA